MSESYTAETFFFLLWLTGRADCLHVQGSNETSNACGESHKWDTTAAQRNQGWVLLVQPFANHRKGKEWVPKRQKKKTKWKKHTTRTSNGTCCNPQPNPTESVQNVKETEQKKTKQKTKQKQPHNNSNGFTLDHVWRCCHVRPAVFLEINQRCCDDCCFFKVDFATAPCSSRFCHNLA